MVSGAGYWHGKWACHMASGAQACHMVSGAQACCMVSGAMFLTCWVGQVNKADVSRLPLIRSVTLMTSAHLVRSKKRRYGLSLWKKVGELWWRE